jgi:hypothetical protein
MVVSEPGKVDRLARFQGLIPLSKSQVGDYASKILAAAGEKKTSISLDELKAAFDGDKNYTVALKEFTAFSDVLASSYF